MSETIFLEYANRFSHGRTLEEIIDWAEAIPPMPESTSRALRMVDDPDSSPSQIAGVLAGDPALSSVVVRAANSAALGRAEAVNTVEDAVLVIGTGTLKSLLYGLTLKKWNTQFGEMEKLVWTKALGTASAAFVVATFLGKTYQEHARLCGLLHNLGQIIMLSDEKVRKQFPDVLTDIREHQVPYDEAERQVIGFSHPLIGATVGRRWNLPMPVCTTILRYAHPFEGIDDRLDEQIAVVKLASQLCLCAGLGWVPGHPLDCDAIQPVAHALGLDAETFIQNKDFLIKQTRALYATEASFFK